MHTRMYTGAHTHTPSQPTHLLPAQFIHQESNQKRAQEAPKGVHGHRHGPQQRQGEGIKRLPGSFVVGVVVKLLHELQVESTDRQKQMNSFCRKN